MYSRARNLAPIPAAIPAQRSMSSSEIVPRTTVKITLGTYLTISRANFNTPAKVSSPKRGWQSLC